MVARRKSVPYFWLTLRHVRAMTFLMKKRFIMVGLTGACLLSGYGFYRMSGDGPFLAVVFTFGILGIMMSVARNMKSE